MLSSISQIKSLRRMLARIAQDVYEVWEPEETGETESGVIREEVAARMLKVLKAAGFVTLFKDGQILARTRDGIYRVDLPSYVYETGTGYAWHKTHGVTISEDNVVLSQVTPDPNKWPEFTGEDLHPGEIWVDPKTQYSEPIKSTSAHVPQILKDGWSPVDRPPNPEWMSVDVVSPTWLDPKSIESGTPQVVSLTNVPEKPDSPLPPVEAVTSPPHAEWTESQKVTQTPATTEFVNSTPPPVKPASAPPPPPEQEYDYAADLLKPSSVVVLKERY